MGVKMVYCTLGDANAVPNNAAVRTGTMGGTTQRRICVVLSSKNVACAHLKVHTNWLWVYKQNNTTIREIITRTTAHTIEEASEETAPLEFQQAHYYLEEMVQNAVQAIKDEQELLRQSPPNNQSYIKYGPMLYGFAAD